MVRLLENKKSKSKITYLILIISFILLSTQLFADTDEKIEVLKNRLLELEKRDIENRVIIQDLKELIVKLSDDVKSLRAQFDSQKDLISSIPKRIPRPGNNSLQVEDTTVTNKIQEVPIEDLSSKQATNDKPPIKIEENKKPIDVPIQNVNNQSKTDKQLLYDTSLKYFQSGSYDTALIKFKEFIDRYPDDDLTDNSQYWIGECHYKKKDYLMAVEEFQRVIEYYPLGNKVPEAYLKIGYSYKSLGDKVSALQYFNLVRDMFPHTDASAEAEKQIRELSTR